MKILPWKTGGQKNPREFRTPGDFAVTAIGLRQNFPRVRGEVPRDKDCGGFHDSIVSKRRELSKWHSQLAGYGFTNAHGPEVRFENALARSDVAVEMEEPSVPVANAEGRGLGFSDLRNERLAPNALGIGNPKEFPKRDEVVASPSEIRTLEYVGVRHPLPRDSNVRIQFVRDGESHYGEQWRIFEFSTRGIRMVDVSSARAKRSAGMLVPIKKIERERKWRNVGIFTFGTLCRIQEKLAFAR